MRITNKFRIRLTGMLLLAISAVLLLFFSATAVGQRGTQPVRVNPTPSQVSTPIYREYRGIRLGMKASEVRAKLGEPVMKSDEQDYFIISSSESTQIVYTADQKVRMISTDYAGGVNAPDHKTVVGSELSARPDGSQFKMVQFDAEGIWVSYNKSAGVMPVVTITIQTPM